MDEVEVEIFSKSGKKRKTLNDVWKGQVVDDENPEVRFARRALKGSVITFLSGNDGSILVELSSVVCKENFKSTQAKKIDLEHRVQDERFTSPQRFLRHTISGQEFDDDCSSAASASRIERTGTSPRGSAVSCTKIRLSTILQRQRCSQGGTVDLNSQRGPHLI